MNRNTRVNNEHLWKLTRNLLDLQKSGKFCDVQLLCLDGTLMAHSAVLVSACSTLQGTIQHLHMHLPMMDYTLDTVQRMVSYLYTGRIEHPPPHEVLSFQALMQSMGLPYTPPNENVMETTVDTDLVPGTLFAHGSAVRLDQDIKPQINQLVDRKLELEGTGDSEDDHMNDDLENINIKQEIDYDEPSTSHSETPEPEMVVTKRGRKRKSVDGDDDEDYTPTKRTTKRKTTPKRLSVTKAKKVSPQATSQHKTPAKATTSAAQDGESDNEQYEERNDAAEGEGIGEGIEKGPKPKKNAYKASCGRNWNEDVMEKALRMIEEGGSVRHVARVLGIPRSTIRHRIDNGPPNERASRLFTPEEEELLLSYLIFMYRAGVKLTGKKGISVAGYIGRKRGTVYHTRDGNPTLGWWNRYKQRHPKLKDIVSEDKNDDTATKVETTSKDLLNEVSKKRMLDGVAKLVKETNGNNEEARFYNMVTVTSRISEQGKLLEFMVPNCITESDDRIMTITVCSCANGTILPSAITMTSALLEKTTIGMKEGLCAETESGDMDCSTFLQYLKHTDAFITHERPVFVFTSGLQDLVSAEVVEFCTDRRIHLLHIPILNVIQPADIIPRVVQAKLEARINGGETQQEENANINVSQVIEMLTSTTCELQGDAVKVAFQQTGMFPFDKDALGPGNFPKREPNNSKECCATKRALALQKRVNTLKAQGKKKLWDEQYMEQAVELVRKDGIPLRTSARIMGVPRWTLRNRIDKGKPKSRQPRLLTSTEEQNIVKQLTFLSMAGRKVTSALALKMADTIANAKGKSLPGGRRGKGHGWLYRFKLRFKELTEWEILDIVKTSKESTEDEKSKQDKEASKFLKKVGCILQKYEAQSDSSRIYNVDSVLNISDELSSTGTESVTATLCICANGTYLPPMLTFAGFLPQGEEYKQQGPEGALYNTAQKGQLDQSLLIEYIRFLDPMLSAIRPVFLFTTDKADLVTDSLMEFCLEKEIWLLNIPKNKVPYFTQPFDNIVPALIAAIETQAATETSIPVNRFKVPWLLKCALSTLEEVQIKTAFKDAGLLQKELVHVPVLTPKKVEEMQDFGSEKCASCKVRLGISGVHCIICGCLYHEACAAKQKGDTTAICKHCLKA